MKRKKRENLKEKSPEFEFRNLRDLEYWRFDRLELHDYLCLLPPIPGFTEEEWQQYEKDCYHAECCIWARLPVPEEVEIRLLKAKAKLDHHFKTSNKKK